MNKKIKSIVVSLILLVTVSMNISYAISIPNTSSFFEVNSQELSVYETLEMIVDLSKINYENFKLVLNSNVEIENIYLDETNEDDNDIKIDKESNDIVINIDKEKLNLNLNLNKMVLYYQIPDNLEVGTKLQLNVQAIISEDDKEKVVDEQQVEILIVQKDNDNNENQEENNNENNKNEDNKDEEFKNFDENINKEQQEKQVNEKVLEGHNDMQNMQVENSNKLVSSISNMQYMSNSVDNSKAAVEQSETATYNGSNNNYLSSLKIDGVELTSDFSKEKTTYFATVEGLDKIIVTAQAETEDSSKIAITGTELKSGENKILISVTAENGDVRYYRIYVTNK